MRAAFLFISLFLIFPIQADEKVPATAKPGDHAATATKRGGQAKGGERMLVYDCGVLNDEARKLLEKKFTVEVVSLTERKEKGAKLNPAARIREDLKARKEPPRLVLLACHGSVETGKLVFSPEPSKSDKTLTFDLKAEDLLKELERPLAKVNNPVLFAMACHSGALEGCVGKQPGAVCAACSASETANPVMFAFQLTRAFDHCAEIDTDGDGKVTSTELGAWFSAKNNVERDIDAFLSEYTGEGEKGVIDRNKEETKRGNAEIARIAKLLPKLEGQYKGEAYRDLVPKKVKESVKTASSGKEQDPWGLAFDEAFANALDWIDSVKGLKELKLDVSDHYMAIRKDYSEFLKKRRDGAEQEESDKLWQSYRKKALAEFDSIEKKITALEEKKEGRKEGLEAVKAGRLWVQSVDAERDRKATSDALATFQLAKAAAAIMRIKTAKVFDGKDKAPIVFYCPAAAKGK